MDQNKQLKDKTETKKNDEQKIRITVVDCMKSVWRLYGTGKY